MEDLRQAQVVARSLGVAEPAIDIEQELMHGPFEFVLDFLCRLDWHSPLDALQTFPGTFRTMFLNYIREAQQRRQELNRAFFYPLLEGYWGRYHFHASQKLRQWLEAVQTAEARKATLLLHPAKLRTKREAVLMLLHHAVHKLKADSVQLIDADFLYNRLATSEDQKLLAVTGALAELREYPTSMVC